MFCLSHFIISTWIIFPIKLRCNLPSPSYPWAFIKGEGLVMWELGKATWRSGQSWHLRRPFLPPVLGAGTQEHSPQPQWTLAVGEGHWCHHAGLMFTKAHFWTLSLHSSHVSQAGWATVPISQRRTWSWEKGFSSWGQVQAGVLPPPPPTTGTLSHRLRTAVHLEHG